VALTTGAVSMSTATASKGSVDDLIFLAARGALGAARRPRFLSWRRRPSSFACANAEAARWRRLDALQSYSARGRWCPRAP
jgi:hypothetical protein